MPSFFSGLAQGLSKTGTLPGDGLLQGMQPMMKPTGGMLQMPLNTDFPPAAMNASPRAKQDIITTIADNKELLESYGITNDLRLRHFLAQIAMESDGFKTLHEYASGKAYEGRKDLGNTELGDGVKYKGRGLIQLTGKANYKKYGDALGVDLIANPELAADPKMALQIALQYWKDHNLNTLADQNDLRGITKRINGGYNGLKDRQRYFDKFQVVSL